ncbi:hypothetical protein NDU88_005715 [Pleurodeles waltl]|uniref:Uncharacterized protein n=1 Tax=Pleurodeles waltl TaxID=8319 RepID=A0AAV7WZI6_PLEWA|nr:hypothetical protein NDU88_005715 [Pleurodeles waltl]
MAAPSEKCISFGSLESKGHLAEARSLEECRERDEEVIVIADEELDGQGGFGFNKKVIDVPDVSDFGKGAGAVGLREPSFERDLGIGSIGGHVRAHHVLKVGEQVDCVDQDGVLVKGLVCGQIGRGDGMGKARVLMDIWQPGFQEVNAGCDAPRFLGRLSEVTVHQDAGRHSGGQSFPVKARAPLVHRKEGRVNSGAVYTTTREVVAGCSLGHGAGSVLDDEQPSTSWGAGASFERQDDTLLDYDEDAKVQDAIVAASVLPSTVPEVVQGDRSGNRRRATAGNLPRGEIGLGMGRIVGGNHGGDVYCSGGVDASVQVDSVADSGAGKSGVSVEVVGEVVRKEDESQKLQDSVKKGDAVGADVSVKGIELDSMKMEVRLPHDKVQQLILFLEDTVKSTKKRQMTY